MTDEKKETSTNSEDPLEEVGLYVMSVAAELVGTHPQTLREYERRGLISPKRSQGGNRRYGNSDQLLEYEKALYQLKQENEELKNSLEDTQERLDDVENRLAQVEETIDGASLAIEKVGIREIVLSTRKESN